MHWQRRLTPSETSLRSFLFSNLRFVEKSERSLRSLWQMISHNTAISSRTDFNPCGEFAVTIHRYQIGRAVVLYPLTHTSNASLLCLCMIIHNRLEVAFSQSLFIFAVCIKGFTCRLLAAFPCSLVEMLCLPD